MDLTARLFRIYRTCLEMLKDRGYLVSEERLKQTLEEFTQSIGDGQTVRRDDLTIFVPKTEDPQDQVMSLVQDLAPHPRRACGHCHRRLILTPPQAAIQHAHCHRTIHYQLRLKLPPPPCSKSMDLGYNCNQANHVAEQCLVFATAAGLKRRYGHSRGPGNSGRQPQLGPQASWS